jgi:hypothetical protein
MATAVPAAGAFIFAPDFRLEEAAISVGYLWTKLLSAEAV